MKIAIILLNFGGGHMEAARNIEKALKEHPEAEVRLIDGMALTPGVLRWALNTLWLRVQNKNHAVWAWMYESAFFRSRVWLYFMNWFPWWGLRRELVAFAPDHVVTTHLACPPMALKLRRLKGLSYRVHCLVTEFVFHPDFNWYPEADSYLVASEAVRDALLARGFPAERIHLTGIPIKKAFAERLDKAEARRKLGLPLDAKIIFFFAGTFGGTAIDAIVKGIRGKGLFPVVVCGKNEETRARMEQMLAAEGMAGKVYGYVDFMNVLMTACDFMIGKGGALLASECLALGTPCIFYGSAPGHEVGNARHLERLGIGAVANNIEEALQHVDRFLVDLGRLEEAGARARAAGFPRASETVAGLLVSGVRA